MDQFMLQRHIPGGEPDKQQRGGNEPEGLPENQRRKPTAINSRDQHPRREFTAPQPALRKTPYGLPLLFM
ncbi:hypothetical protein D3C78_1282740 [compost metagenome]